MKNEVVEQNTRLRHYLLDELPADEQQLIEERLLIDNDYLEQMLIVEEVLLDDYSADRLSPQQKSKYQKLFLATPEGRQKLKISQVLKKHLNNFPSEAARQTTFAERIQMAFAGLFSAPVLAAAAAVMAVGLGIMGWWAVSQSDLKKGITALQSAYGEHRPLEARITGFAYASYSESSKLPTPSSAKLKVAEKAFHDLLDDKKTASSLQGLGKYALTQRKYDEAIRNLNEAAKADPNNSAIHTDLAVAFLERGKIALTSPHPEMAQADFGECRKHLDFALVSNPASPEALFNLALLFQITKSWKEAETIWQRFLAVEHNKDWAEEGKRYLNQAIEAQKN